jgi:thiopurine S-methyltransferase
VHEALKQHGEKLIPGLFSDDDEECINNPVRVFFPLCGKSLDMAFLTKEEAVKEVWGVDGIRKALTEFAKEQPELEIMTDGQRVGGGYEQLRGKNITLLRGDFFNLDESVTDGRFEAIFDRASLVAIDPTLREHYVSVQRKLIEPQGKILLITVERTTGTEADLTGPPFSVPEQEVRRLYEEQDWVESVKVLGEEVESQERRSKYYLIQAR